MCFWSSLIALADARMMYLMRRFRGHVRKTDLIQFIVLTSCSVVGLLVLFVHPGLIYKIPSGIIALEIASIPMLMYLTQLLAENVKRVQQIRG